jgi:hypothetical protein
LRLWIDDSTAREHRIWELPALEVVHTADVPIRIPGWNPVGGESFKEYAARVRKDLLAGLLEEQLQEYEAAARRDAERYQWLLEPGPERSEVFMWAVRCHVLQERIQHVARDSNRDESRVREQVNRLLQMLDLTRNRPRGRPRSVTRRRQSGGR